MKAGKQRNKTKHHCDQKDNPFKGVIMR